MNEVVNTNIDYVITSLQKMKEDCQKYKNEEAAQNLLRTIDWLLDNTTDKISSVFSVTGLLIAGNEELTNLFLSHLEKDRLIIELARELDKLKKDV